MIILKGFVCSVKKKCFKKIKLWHMTFGRKNELVNKTNEHRQIMKIHMQFDVDIHTILYRKRYPNIIIIRIEGSLKF